jgi:hypothetical protein
MCSPRPQLPVDRPLVALAPQWRQNYPNNRPPTRAKAISEMGQKPASTDDRPFGVTTWSGLARHTRFNRGKPLPQFRQVVLRQMPVAPRRYAPRPIDQLDLLVAM